MNPLLTVDLLNTCTLCTYIDCVILNRNLYFYFSKAECNSLVQHIYLGEYQPQAAIWAGGWESQQKQLIIMSAFVRVLRMSVPLSLATFFGCKD